VGRWREPRGGEVGAAAQACCAQQHAARWDWEQVEPARGDDGRLLQDSSVVGQSVAGQQPDGAEVPAVANGAASCRHNRPLMASPFRATNSTPTPRQSYLKIGLLNYFVYLTYSFISLLGPLRITIRYRGYNFINTLLNLTGGSDGNDATP
jgi:hypothetical protein